MRLSPSGIARAGLAAAAGAGLVAGAMQLPGAFAVGPRGADAASTDTATTTVRGAALVCPGPELKGLKGVTDAAVGARVAAVAAPTSLLGNVKPAAADGAVTLSGMPRGAVGAPVTTRGAVTSGDVGQPVPVLASGTQSQAPGLAAMQSWYAASGDHRSLGTVACGPAAADLWLIGGGGEPGRQERLLLANPGGNAVTVDLTLHGAKGPVDSPTGKGVVVPAHSRVSVLLDSISGTEKTPVVHVAASGGLVSAVLNDSWLDGTVAAGSDDVVPSAAPSRDQVIPGVPVDGAASVRVAVPGDGEAVVQARVLTAQGPRALPKGGVARVQGGTVQDLDLTGLPKGTYAVQVRADVPVVAGAVVARRDGSKPGDFAWSSSTRPITGVAGAPLTPPAGAPADLGHWMLLTSEKAPSVVDVVSADAAGKVSAQRVTVPADSAFAVPVKGASAWVHQVSGKGLLRAALGSQVGQRADALISVAPLEDSPMRTTTVGLREAAQSESP
ncbi:MAG TPA: DUF5719 family protein [Pedococcus sp.]